MCFFKCKHVLLKRGMTERVLTRYLLISYLYFLLFTTYYTIKFYDNSFIGLSIIFRIVYILPTFQFTAKHNIKISSTKRSAILY